MLIHLKVWAHEFINHSWTTDRIKMCALNKGFTILKLGKLTSNPLHSVMCYILSVNIAAVYKSTSSYPVIY